VGPPRGNDIHAATGDDRIHEAVAAAIGQLVVGVAKTAQIVGVVVQSEIGRRVAAGDLTRPIRVALQHDRLLDGE